MPHPRKLGILLLIFLLGLNATALASGAVNLNSAERYTMNLFLSNFTEVGSDVRSSGPDRDRVDFAHDHLWFNDRDSFEYGEFANDMNCRVPDGRIQEIIDKYFYEPENADLSDTRFPYEDGYYYHEETGGASNMGFALTLGAYETEPGIYYAAFLTFAPGMPRDSGDLRLSLAEAEEKFGIPQHGGRAWIAAGDLSNRSTYRIIDFAY